MIRHDHFKVSRLLIPSSVLLVLCLLHVGYAYNSADYYNWGLSQVLSIGLSPVLGPFAGFIYVGDESSETLLYGQAIIVAVMFLSCSVFKSTKTTVISVIGAFAWYCLGFFWTWVLST
jgi:hypothetical protein